MEGSTGRLDVAALLQEVEVLQLVAVEVAAHVDALAPEENKGQLASDATRAPLEAFRIICEEGKNKEQMDLETQMISVGKIGSLQMQNKLIKTHEKA